MVWTVVVLEMYSTKPLRLLVKDGSVERLAVLDQLGPSQLTTLKRYIGSTMDRPCRELTIVFFCLSFRCKPGTSGVEVYKDFARSLCTKCSVP
jgi:hypothetical protein